MSLTVNGNPLLVKYKGNLTALTSGNAYTFQLKVGKDYVTVTTSDVTEWTGKTTDVASYDVFTASDLKIGDYYYSDGNTSDGGLRKRYVNGIFEKKDVDPVLTDAGGQARTVVGIVFWVGDPTNTTDGDPLLKTQHPGCTHGLVVALHEAKNPSNNTAAQMNWSTAYEQVNNWTNHTDRGGSKVDITEENKLQGYANTVALKAYNESSNVQGNTGLRVLPIAAIEQYQIDYPAPTNSSGWYVPSIMELKYMCWGQGNDKKTTGRDLLDDQFAKVGGTNVDSGSSYYSSSEHAQNSKNAWCVYFDDGHVGSSNKNNIELWVRALFAF